MKQITNELLQQIPQLKEADLKELIIKRLGGLTNLVYRVDHEDKRYLLRLPGKGTETFIDRKVEAHNAQLAAQVGVSAHIHYFDSTTGLMLAEFLEGETMTANNFRQRKGAPARAGSILKKLHGSGAVFQFRFELFSMIDEYLGTLGKLNATLPKGYHETVKQAQPIRAALDRHPGVLAPCHCDPLVENFIDTGEQMWMVDWEYSGMNDPLWDLGDLSVEAGFSDAQDAEMLATYCGGDITDRIEARMVIYKAMSDLLWTLWGLIQHANGNPAEDFWAYALDRFERCQTLMVTDDFQDRITAL